MKLAKRIVSLVAVAAIAVTFVGVNAFADDEVEARRINFYDNEKTFDVDDTYQLNWEVLPTDYTNDIGNIRFSSSNRDVVEVDNDGYIEAVGPGTATITARASKGRAQGTITLTVRGKRNSSSRRDYDEDYYDQRDDRSSSRRDDYYYSSSSSSTRSADRNVTLSRTADRDTVVNAVRGSSSGSFVTLSNYASVSMDTLAAAANAGKASIRFDTRSSDTFVGRVIVNPSRAVSLNGNIKLGVHVNNDNTTAVYNKYNRQYGNKLQVIYCEQSQFGMTVTIVAKFATNARAEDLRFYSYNSSSGTHTQFTPSGVRIDNKGFVYFDTSVGGTIIVSEGTLS